MRLSVVAPYPRDNRMHTHASSGEVIVVVEGVAGILRDYLLSQPRVSV